MTETDAGPFQADLFGGSPKTATCALETYSEATTARGSLEECRTSLSAPATRSSYAQRKATRRSRGDIPDFAETARRALSAPSSATGARTSRRSLSDKLTLSLMSAGLVRGITPSSTRKQSGQPIQVFAFDRPGGGGAAKPPSGFSSSNGSDEESELEPEPLCPFCGAYSPRQCELEDETDGVCPWEEMQP